MSFDSFYDTDEENELSVRN